MHKKLLVVEDDRDIREALRDGLNLLGYEVALASNGQEALSYLAENEKPCLILLDIMMPVMDGTKFRECQLQDAAIASIPVVVMTADRNASQKSAQMGAQAGIKKPFEIEELIRVVSQFCG